jgi:hypothetical protein
MSGAADGVAAIWILVDVGLVLAAVWLLARDAPERRADAAGDPTRDRRR